MTVLRRIDMNNYKKQNYPKKRILLLDELAIILSMAIALVMRYGGEAIYFYRLNKEGLYVYLIVTICVLQVFVFLIYDFRRKHVFLQDPVENLISVVIGKAVILALSLLFLYALKFSEYASRRVVGMFFVFCILLSYTFRMLYRKKKKDIFLGMVDRKTFKVTLPAAADETIEKFYASGCDDILIVGTDNNRDSADAVIKEAEKRGVRTYLALDIKGYDVRSGIVTDMDGFASIPAFVRSERFDVFGIRYAIARTEEAVYHVLAHLKELSGKYICFSNVHTSVMGRENPEYRDVLNNSAFTFPDGTPIAKLQQKAGYVGAERVAGPDFMEHMFKDTADGSVSHYFYGASQETLDALKDNLLKKYPGIDIRGMYSPPFRPLTEEEDNEDVERINASGADIVWIGLGAPKQEKWMLAHKDRVKGVMMGVGAGFDFHGGTIKRAPVWIQKVGLEWLFRLFQDPGRLFKRYFVTNTKFFCFLFMDLIKRR